MSFTDVLGGLTDWVAYKNPCAAATTTDMTGALIGLPVIDGYQVQSGDRILVWRNTNNTTNGIYTASSGAWSRASDFTSSSSVAEGTQVLVVNGAAYGGVVFELTSPNPISIGSSAIIFEEAGGSSSLITGGYQGALTADPTVDRAGNALTLYAWYFNTTLGRIRSYASGAWTVANAQIYSNVGAPASTLGAVGDFSIDPVAGNLYGPKTGAGWPSALSLIGPSAWGTVAAWAPFTAYSASAPASIVTNGGNTYVCNTPHTSGASFSATNWTMVAAGAALYPSPDVCQTVSAGPLDSNGQASTLLPSSTANLAISTANVTSSVPLIVTAAAGWGVNGDIDYISVFTSNLSWSALTANATNYLFVNAQTGATYSSILAPIYQYGGSPSTTSGQFTFVISQMKGYLGNGSAAVATPLVCIGQATTGSSTVTGSIGYTYNGYYDSGYTATLPAAGTATSYNHNLGIQANGMVLYLECTTSNGGYSTGDVITAIIAEYTGAIVFNNPQTLWSNVNTGGWTAGASAIQALNKSTGEQASLTAADWSYRMVFRRGWGGA